MVKKKCLHIEFGIIRYFALNSQRLINNEDHNEFFGILQLLGFSEFIFN